MKKPKKLTVTINAMLTHETNEDIQEDRGIDLTLNDGANMRMVLGLLFEGFPQRLKDAGFQVHDVTNFTG